MQCSGHCGLSVYLVSWTKAQGQESILLDIRDKLVYPFSGLLGRYTLGPSGGSLFSSKEVYVVYTSTKA